MTSLGANAAFGAASNLTGNRFDPYRDFNFLVEIERILVGGFREVSGLQIETEVEDYREGGCNEYVHKLAGPTRHPSNLVLKRGIIELETLWTWHQDVSAGQFERRNGTIYLLDNLRAPVMWWDFREAYPVKWTGPNFKADSNNVAIETIELVHHGITRPAASTAVSAARLAAGGAGQVI